ncbi:MAG: heat shock factor-binding 1 family protein [Treponema sp.]|nr:heat shock factor-binding 1 family protein [Treponema sp.]
MYDTFESFENPNKKFCVCGGCGRTIEKQFVYCPWCGGPKMSTGPKTEFDMEVIFNRLEELQTDDRNARIAQMGSRLDELEKELDSLVLCAEMHK